MAVTLSSLAGAGAQFFDNNGVPLAGGLIYTYLAGTSTPEATYTSSTGVTAHANPIVLDAAGRIATGEVWLTSGIDYKFLVKTSANVQLGSYDNIPSINDFTSIYAELANTTNPAFGDALVGFRQSDSLGNLSGAVGRTVHQKLQEFVSVKDFGATGDGVTDDTTAIQTAINTCAPLGKTVYFPSGVYITTATVGLTKANAAQFGLRIAGENSIYTEIKASHSAGAVLALNRSYGSVSDIALTASTARNTGAAGSNYGLLMEAPDSADQSVASMSIIRVRVIGQPSHGIVHVGNTQLSYYEQVLCQSNKGHGFVFDEGVITSRVNTSSPGLVNLVSCWSLQNTGHGLLIGSPSDTRYPVRFSMYNCEFAENALTAGVRLTADEVWIRGINITFDTCAIGTTGAAVIGNIRFAGEVLFVRNHRSVSATHTLRLEKDHNQPVTYGVVIDGLRILNQTQNPVVIITDIADVRDVTANTFGSTSNMVSMFTPGAVNAIWNRFPTLSVVRKTTNQTVNNSTTLVDDTQLKLQLAASETVYFEAIVRYSGDNTADIKIAFVGPTGATIRWDNYNSIFINTSDVVTVSNGEAVEGGSRSFGCASASGVRTLNIKGYVQTSTTAGELTMQFAQASAVAADTTIQFNSVLKVFRNNANI
jgi:hypothetical protein